MDAEVTRRQGRRSSLGPIVKQVAPERRAAFGRRLRTWFRAHGRDLPWRRTRDPYRILVSELMLQQTQVSRVVDYYPRFLERFPTLADVGRARPTQVLEAWSGLGYYARARNLHKLAAWLTDRGETTAPALPDDPDALRRLPGIGPYTAGAIASFAFERRAPLVDTNVARVIKRVFAPRLDVTTGRGQKAVWELARQLLPRTGRHAWTHNQALMELGALVCTARVAHCEVCPVRTLCGSAPRLTKRRHRVNSESDTTATDDTRARRRSGVNPPTLRLP